MKKGETMFKSKHVTIKFRSPYLEGLLPLVVNTNLKSTLFAKIFAVGTTGVYREVQDAYDSLGLFGTIDIEFDIHPVWGMSNLMITRHSFDW
jgi:hypothetical protein